MSEDRTIPLNAPLRALLLTAQAGIDTATRERDTIVRTILASQAIETDAVTYALTEAGLVLTSTESMP